MKIRNICPRGALDVPLLGCVVKAGEVVDVTPDQARRLLPQVDNYEPVDKDAKAVLVELLAPAVAAADTEGSPA